MNTVLVTGGLGYIGTVLTEYLGRRGFRCIAFDTGLFRDCTLMPPREPDVVLRDARRLVLDDLRGVDAVVHLAGISNDPFGNLEPAKIYDPTRVYALHVASLCKQLGIQFIFASSCSVYGIGRQALLDEDGPTVPQTPYSLNKRQIETDLDDLSDATFSPIALRLATVFGMSPRMRFDLVINMFVGMALTTGRIVLNSNGRAWRPYVHIEDACEVIRLSLECEHRSGELLVLNVGDTQQNFQVLQLAEMVRELVAGCEVVFLRDCQVGASAALELARDRKIQDNVDKRTYRVSFEKIKTALPGFQIRTTVRDGIKSMVDDLRSIGLREEQFQCVDFYRLQKMEQLLIQGAVSEDLLWC